MKKLIVITLMLIACITQAQQLERGSVLIKNGTVLTITKGILENTDVLIKDGKISQIGKNIAAPAGAKVIDATGHHVMPGIIDAHSHLALQDINEATSPVTSMVWEGDDLNPLDIGMYRALAGGVTISHAMHGSANAIGAQCQVIKHRYGTVDPKVLIMEGAPRTIKFALGENPTRVHGNNGAGLVPNTRMGVEFVIRQALSEGKEYMDKWSKYNASKKLKGFRGAPPKYDERMETMAAVLRGEIIIHCHSYRSDEIYMLLNVCKDFGIKRVVFQHVNEGFKVAPELAAHGAMASVFVDHWAYKFEVYYSTAYNPAILVRNGVLTSVNSDSPDRTRYLYHEAGKTQKYGGLTDQEALELITINPARQLGIENRVGSLETGKDGDVVIFKGHPLSIYAVPVFTLIDGVVKFDRANDPDDMRLYVNPRQTIDVTDAVIESSHNHHQCMKNAEFLLNVKFADQNR